MAIGTISGMAVDSNHCLSWFLGINLSILHIIYSLYLHQDGRESKMKRLVARSVLFLGVVGTGGGAIYVTNGVRDYAVVLGALGTTRVHLWTDSGWRL